MPWEAWEANKHKKGLSQSSKSKWSSIANSILAQTGDESQAIRIANSRVQASVRRLQKMKGR